ncbi:MAG: aminomethyl-transferring glycine dehydrogenase subunit GcvPA [SAR202 cluster bacterium]|nr:aminomethyl-transferring glycine dehydrogenase subunit GcvPA [SAR202 cluster bacterium]
MTSTGFTSPYTPNTDADRREMLKAIGVQSVDDLFQDIPSAHRDPRLNIPAPASELELRREMEALARMNATPGDYACFLGGGAYRHHVPAVVRQIAGRSEFMTSYTPYQPEVSQGTLQTHFEFQSLICQLTGMEVANAGMYDGATSLAEACLMACRVTKRGKVMVLDTVSPSYRAVMKTFVEAPPITVETVKPSEANITDEYACVVVQQPNYFGYFEDAAGLAKKAHDVGALLVVSVDLPSLGMFTPPGGYDADIVTAEGQAMGIAPTFGGPYVGVFACKEKHIRQMPGRIVGKTVDTKGRTGYVLTLQTREQHIRRERATSNICTSVGLIALMATVYMASQGRQGLRRVAELGYHKAHYLASLIAKIPGYSLPVEGTFFREFVVSCPKPPAEINKGLLKHKILGGVDVSDRFKNGMLLCCTEVNSKAEIEALAKALAEAGKKS